MRPVRPGRRRAGWTPVLCAGLLALLGSGAAAQAVVAPEVRAEAARLLRELGAIRGLADPGPAPPIVVRSREERRRYVAGEVARKYSPARLEAERRALRAWGLVPPEFDLREFVADLLAEQAAAYYDPIARRLILANWLTPELRRDALAHELVHALQDRAIGLDAFLSAASGDSDAALARQALVEGEAVALQQELALRRSGRDFASLPDVSALRRAIVESPTGPVLARAPRFLRTRLTFPYAEGVAFVHAVRQRRPWAALAAVYADPPRSSAEILHPERYFDGRQPAAAVALPDLASALPPGARRVIEDVLGEFGLGEVLAAGGAEPGLASGWRGDRYAIWEAAGADVLVGLSVWESDATAAAFARALAGVLAARHGLPPPPPDAASTSKSGAAAGLLVERRDRRVLLVQHAPPGSLERVRGAAWQTPVVY